MTQFIGQEKSGAIFSPCERYRYSLWRWWGAPPLAPYPPDMVAFICLNPSTADATLNDPTVTRCCNFAKRWGYGGMAMLNLFAHRDTDPKLMLLSNNPIGPLNNNAIRTVAEACAFRVCAWGAHGSHLGRDKIVTWLLRDLPLYCLTLTKGGHPGHPLYLSGELKPVLME